MSKIHKILPPILAILTVPAAVLPYIFYGNSSFTFSSMAVMILALLALFISIENKKMTVRIVCATAVMTALSVAGRLVFSPIPGFKPVTALVVICAMYFGSSSGFLCGALSALISNIYFGQGPWTPVQMFTWGMIGLVAGLIGTKLKTSYILLIFFGAFSGVVYSLVLDAWSVQWYSGSFSLPMYITALATSLPFMLIYMLSNVAFLVALQKMCGKSLQRITVKYGIGTVSTDS